MSGRPASADAAGGGRPVRVLFLAWGPSVHAERRIGLFASDSGFRTAVVSSHDFRLPGAQTFRLAGSEAREEIGKRLAAVLAAEAARRHAPSVRERASWLVGRAAEHIRVGRILARLGLRDLSLLREAMGSFDILREVEVGMEDFNVLGRAVREFRPDVLFLQTLLYPSYLALFLPREIPTVVTFWNGDLTWWAEWNGIERLIKRRIVVSGATRAGAVTVNSRAAADACRSLGVAERRIHLIRYPGVDRSRFVPLEKEAARRALGIAASRVVVCPRGLGGYLNSEAIVAAAARVAARHPDVLFVFLSGVGGEQERERHRRLALECGADRNCRFAGQVPWEEMPSWYGAADAMISASSRDSLPNTMLEAMACRVPVIMADIPAVREWVVDGETGFLVPPGDAEALATAILRVLDDPTERIEAVTEKAFVLAARDADGDASARRVKELVRRIAGGSS